MSAYHFLVGGIIVSSIYYIIPTKSKMDIALRMYSIYENICETMNQALITNTYSITTLPGKQHQDLPFEFEDLKSMITYINENIAKLPNICVITYVCKDKTQKKHEFTWLLDLDRPIEYVIDNVLTFESIVSQSHDTIEDPIMTLEVNDENHPEVAELFRRCMGPKGDFYGNREFPLKHFYQYTQCLRNNKRLKDTDKLTIIYSDTPFEESTYTIDDIISDFE